MPRERTNWHTYRKELVEVQEMTPAEADAHVRFQKALRRNPGKFPHQLFFQTAVAGGRMTEAEARKGMQFLRGTKSEAVGESRFWGIHGWTRLTPLEAQLLRTPEFARLHNVRQLSAMPVFFNSAKQSRLSHTLEVMHLTDVASQKLPVTATQRRYLRLAAMFHDAGHAAFSHYADRILQERLGKSHEDLGIAMLERPHIKALLVRSHINPNTLRQYLEGGMGELISGEFGTDRMAYFIGDTADLFGSHVRPTIFGEGQRRVITNFPQQHLGAEGDLKQLYSALEEVGGLPRIQAIVSKLYDHLAVKDGRVVLKESGMALATEFLQYRAFLRKHVYEHNTALLPKGAVEKALDLGVRQGIITMDQLVSEGDSSVRNRLSQDPSIAKLLLHDSVELRGQYHAIEENALNSEGQKALADGRIQADLIARLRRRLQETDFFVVATKKKQPIHLLPVLTTKGKIEERKIVLPQKFAPRPKIVVGWNPEKEADARKALQEVLAKYKRKRSAAGEI